VGREQSPVAESGVGYMPAIACYPTLVSYVDILRMLFLSFLVKDFKVFLVKGFVIIADTVSRTFNVVSS